MPVPELDGIRAVQPRSDHVVTAWLGYLSTDDPTNVTDLEHYRLRSATDPAFKEGLHPTSISRFSRAGRSANASANWRMLMDHFIHLHFDQPFQPGHRYFLEVDPAVLPRNLPRTGHFSVSMRPPTRASSSTRSATTTSANKSTSTSLPTSVMVRRWIFRN